MSTLIAMAMLLGINAADKCTTWYDQTTHGKIFRNVRDFGAVGNGVNDDTAAIQAAIDHDREDGSPTKLPAVVYLPPGTYLISDTLVCWFYTHLIGSSACNSTIVLAPSSAGFATAASGLRWGYYLKPAVVFQAGFNQSTARHAWWANQNGCPDGSCNMSDGMNNNFFSEARNLHIRIGRGNPGASSLLWDVAQQTSVRNVSFDLTASGAVALDVSGGTDLDGSNPLSPPLRLSASPPLFSSSRTHTHTHTHTSPSIHAWQGPTCWPSRGIAMGVASAAAGRSRT